MTPVFAPFRPRAPWWGSDLQTLRNALRHRTPDLRQYPTERLVLPLEDGTGDRLAAILQSPLPGVLARPLAVLVHGLSGSAESAYMQTSAAQLLGAGHPVVRLDLRGAGASRPLCRLQYHAGRTEDLRAALRALPAGLTRDGVLLVGYSLGANMLLKYLGEGGGGAPVRAAAAVSAPIDLAAGAARIVAPRNRVYHANLLRGMKREAREPGAELSGSEWSAIESARTIIEFDDRFVARRNGWKDAAEYYAAASALGFLPEIRVPTLVVHALDDPWIPAEAYVRFAWGDRPELVPLLAPGGGHVGFHGRGSRVPWHDRCIAAFFAEQAA